MKKVIIVWASSGIGEALVREFASHWYEVDLLARSVALMYEVCKNIKTKFYVDFLDVRDFDNSSDTLLNLIEKMNGVNVIVLNSGVGYINTDFDWFLDREVLEVNTMWFTLLANTAMKYFKGQKSWHLVWVSSISSLRGLSDGPSYSASKTYISNFLEGLSLISFKEGLWVKITDVRPGFVDTKMAKWNGIFWLSKTSKAAKQIYMAVKKKKRVVYVSRRWRLVAFLMKILPFWIYKKLI